jgi:hypothetical protein
MSTMLADTPNFAHITNVISQSTAPAFVLGAVAGFLSILTGRLERIGDRARGLREASPPSVSIRAGVDPVGIALRRQEFLYQAIYFAILSALTTATLLLVAFAAALFEVRHEHGVAILFSVALILFMISLVHFLREIRLAIRTRHID